MQNEVKKFRFDFYPAFWLLILTGFAALGLRGFKTANPTPKIDGSGPNCCSDGLLKWALHVSGASQKITAEFDKLPSMHPIVVFWPDIDSRAIVGYQAVSYLSWPRAAWSVPMDEQRIGEAVGNFKNAPFSAMIFFILKPSVPLQDSREIGRLTIVPLEQKSK